MVRETQTGEGPAIHKWVPQTLCLFMRTQVQTTQGDRNLITKGKPVIKAKDEGT